MSSDEKSKMESAIAETLRKMQKATVTASSSSYVVRRLSGEIIVERSDKGWGSESEYFQGYKKAS